MSQKRSKIFKNILKAISIIAIIIYAYSLTPKVFQNDTFYTIKIGETITKDTEHIFDLLPWNDGLDMRDHYSYHNLPYTYPHWLYDYLTYQIYSIGNFDGVYIATCILAVVMGLLIYFVNLKLNKNDIISFLITIGSLYCLKNFITARAQLVTFILFILEIFGIEQFIRTKKIRYVALLVAIPILIANLHCAVWPFYFVLYVPYILEYVCFSCVSINYGALLRRIKLFLKKKMNKINKQQLELENNKIEEMKKNYRKNLDGKLSKTYKLELTKQNNLKWLIIVFVICIFTGFLTPIKLTPYTYLLKTTEGNTTQNISEHLPLTLIKNEDMIVILTLIFGILIFSKSKIALRDFFMIIGLIALSFISQRQVSMLVLIGNFILARMLCNVVQNIKGFFKVQNDVNTEKEFFYVRTIINLLVVALVCVMSVHNYIEKKHDIYVDEKSYPVDAVKYINEELIPKVGKENLRLYNEYNYGSYLLFSGIPVFIDSRADLYTPEFNGKEDEQGNYVGNDIFSDFLDISSLSTNYEEKFEEYGITHVIIYSDSKLNSLLEKDENYSAIYNDDNFKIYERETVYE